MFLKCCSTTIVQKEIQPVETFVKTVDIADEQIWRAASTGRYVLFNRLEKRRKIPRNLSTGGLVLSTG